MKTKHVFESRIISDSMRPLIRKGDLTIAEPCKKPKIGDIVLFKLDKEMIIGNKKTRYITHRLVGMKKARNKNILLEKGDSALCCNMLPEKCAVGRITAIKNKERTIDLHKGVWKFYTKAMKITSIAEHNIFNSLMPLTSRMPKIINKAMLKSMYIIKIMQYKTACLLDHK